MRLHFQNDTEPIFTLLEGYRRELLAHPLLEAARNRTLTEQTLHEFAVAQYLDSLAWIPMLAQMRSKATRSRRLRDAISDNIAHEAGLSGTSHVTLAVEMLRSMGIRRLPESALAELARVSTEWLSDEFASATEAELAGWLLVAESLVPVMFAAVGPCFDALGDTRYFSEHVHIDSDEHARWMAEAVADVVAQYGPACVPEITSGMAEGWQETIEVPDELWGRQCASR